MELLATGRGIGYLLKSRVTDVTEFVETLERAPTRASPGGCGSPRGRSRSTCAAFWPSCVFRRPTTITLEVLEVVTFLEAR